jgi:hypothetical protein
MSIFVSVFTWFGYALSAPSRGTRSRVASCIALVYVCVQLVIAAQRVIRLSPTGKPWRVRAVVAIGFMTLNLYLVGFATLYLSFGAGGSNFLAGPAPADRLGRLDAAYFTMTTFTTTGYGDWHPASQAARALVLAQMATGFVIVSVLLVLALSSLMGRQEVRRTE